MQKQIEIFFCYAHEDESYRQLLEKHLEPLRRQGFIKIWHDHYITAGSNSQKEIDSHLTTAHIILLLISPDFMHSDYCYNVVTKRAMERYERGEVDIIPVILRPIYWQSAPFGQLQALPRDGKPVSSWDLDEAFFDVAEGIRKIIEKMLDHPLPFPLASEHPVPVALPTRWNVPRWNNFHFLGRDEQLVQMEQVFQRTGTHTTASSRISHLIISGLGGIGKTQLAIEYAYRYSQHYQAVLWVQAATLQSLISSYIELAQLLDLPQKNETDTMQIRDAVKSWFQTTNDQWLLIFDNADEPELLADFLPTHKIGHILITTRRSDLPEPAHTIDLDVLDEATSSLFLLRRTNRLAPDASLDQAKEYEQQLARELAHKLGGLPLALEQAGAYIATTRKGLADYLSLYERQRTKLLSRRQDVPHDYLEPVATTWDISFERVIQRNAAAIDLFHFCAFLAPDAIPEEMITVGAEHLGERLQQVADDELAFDKLLEDIQAYSLLRRDGERRMLHLHRLVQMVLRDRLDQERQQAWKKRVVNVLAMSEMFPLTNFETKAQSQRVIAHALECLNWEDSETLHTKEMVAVCLKVARYFLDHGQYKEAELPLQQALPMLKNVIHVKGYISHELANIYGAQGRYREAETLYIQALDLLKQLKDMFEKVNTEVAQYLHTYMVDVMNNLGTLYYDTGSYATAESIYKDVLYITEHQQGAEHADTAQSLHNLGELYSAQKRKAEAEALLVKALDIRERVLGPEHPFVANTLSSLSKLYQSQEHYRQAENLLQRALYIYEKAVKAEHPVVGSILNNLAHVYWAQGKNEEAKALFQRALSILKEQLVPEHPYIAGIQDNLALLRENQKMREKEPQKDTFPKEKVVSLYEQARLFMNQGKPEKAEQLHQKILRLQEPVLGSDHPFIAASLNNLATIYRVQDRCLEAEAYGQQSLRIIEQALGSDDLKVVPPLINLATLFISQGKGKKAEEFCLRALDIRERSLGPDHPDVAQVLVNLAAIYRAQSKCEEAKLHCQRALKIYQQSLGFSHLSTLEVQDLYNRIVEDVEKQG